MLAIGGPLCPGRPYLLDEPSMGLSPAMVLRAWASSEAAASCLTVLMVEQNVGVAESLSDTAYVLENGRITMSGNEELASPSLRGLFGHAGAKS